MNITEFAKKAGVSRVSIYEAIKSGTLEKKAGGGIDEKSQLSRDYIQRQKSPDAPKRKLPRKFSDGRSGGEYAEQTGVDTRRLKDELLKQQIIALQLKNLSESGALLTRGIVIDKFVYPAQDALKKMVGDLSQSLPMKIFDMCKNGDTLQDAQAEALKMINRSVGASVKKIAKGLDEIKTDQH